MWILDDSGVCYLMWKREKKCKKGMPPERFELSTPGLQDQCSNPWAMEAVSSTSLKR